MAGVVAVVVGATADDDDGKPVAEVVEGAGDVGLLVVPLLHAERPTNSSGTVPDAIDALVSFEVMAGV